MWLYLGKKTSRPQKVVETGTEGEDGVDYEWIPKSALRSTPASGKTSPRQRKNKAGSDSDWGKRVDGGEISSPETTPLQFWRIPSPGFLARNWTLRSYYWQPHFIWHILKDQSTFQNKAIGLVCQELHLVLGRRFFRAQCVRPHNRCLVLCAWGRRCSNARTH